MRCKACGLLTREGELCTPCRTVWEMSPERHRAWVHESAGQLAAAASAFVDWVTRRRLERQHGGAPPAR